MRRPFVVAVAAFLAAAALPSSAHEGHVHKIMGTVTAVHADTGHVEVKDTQGAAQSFYVDKSTRILKGRQALGLSDLKAGTRVVVEAKTTDGRLRASLVRVGGATRP